MVYMDKVYLLINIAVVILCSFVFVALLFLLLMAPGRRSRRGKTQLPDVIYAHRGLFGGKVPENSLLAFTLAIAKGYGIELDVQLTRDGVAVVFHDDNAQRVCGADKNICDMTMPEVEQLRLSGSSEKIPLFTEVLSLVDGKVPLIIELKCPKASMAQPLCEAVSKILDSYGGGYCIESFNPIALIWYKKQRPDIIRGQLSDAFMRKRETRSAMYFVLHNMLFNIAARPDFIAYNIHGADTLAFRAVKSLYCPALVGWTIRSQKELDSAYAIFDRMIFEGFIPASKPGENKNY